MLPFLPPATANIQQNVQNVPAGLCEAFFAALEAAASACTSGNTEPSLTHAAKKLLQVQADPQHDPSSLASIVSLQALILMIVASINSGPSGIESNRWFGLALATATSSKLQLHRFQLPKETNDPFAIPAQGRRAWLILFILDRWHAAATVVPPVIPEASARLIDSDFALIGAPAYHLYRTHNFSSH